MPARVRILTFDGCPHREAALRLVRAVADAHAIAPILEHLDVTTDDEAVSLRFLGSPTIQVDGVDVEPAARGRTEFAIGCRLYGRSSLPDPGLIEMALREAG